MAPRGKLPALVVPVIRQGPPSSMEALLAVCQGTDGSKPCPCLEYLRHGQEREDDGQDHPFCGEARLHLTYVLPIITDQKTGNFAHEEICYHKAELMNKIIGGNINGRK